ncbi:MAG: hypothetical protein WBB36_15650, partial [Chitinophagales bacterium]
AILGEHDLFGMDEKILGIIWDGTGLGSDGNSWGGEFFIYEKGNMTRAYYLEPIINLAGDKIAKEPRIAALAIAGDLQEAASILRPKFSDLEWNFYRKALSQPAIQTSSAGRYFDGVASLLNLVNMNSYEGEAALLLEKYAGDYFEEHGPEIISHYFNEEIAAPEIRMHGVIKSIVNDIHSNVPVATVSALFHNSMAAIIRNVAVKEGIQKIAFSGGVFQNAVLVDLIHLQLEPNFKIYFHQQLSPNDECIAFGQLMHYLNIN